jgi:hypothetical protein
MTDAGVHMKDPFPFVLRDRSTNPFTLRTLRYRRTGLRAKGYGPYGTELQAGERLL